MAPFDRRAQRQLAAAGPAAASEEARLCSSRRSSAAGDSSSDARRGELDRERKAVEPEADLRDGLRVVAVSGEVRRDRAGAVDEERDGLGLRLRAAGRARSGEPQRRTGKVCSPERRSGMRLVTRT